MKRHRTLHRNVVRPNGGRLLPIFPITLIYLSLGLGSALLGGCVAVPAVMMTSAAVTAAAVVSEGERLVQYPDAERSVIVQHDTDGASACRQTCQRNEASPEIDKPAAEEHEEVSEGLRNDFVI